MKAAVKTAAILVGVLFILSGLVKANDPLGLSYKMQEFFEVWNSELANNSFFLKGALTSLITFSNAHALALSVIMITLEIMAGVALLIGWQKKSVLWLLFGLIVFFTFLTGYAYASGKFKNCGCFGDCLPISPLASFGKDIVLLLLILFLLAAQRYLQPLFSRKAQWLTLGGALLVSIGLQWYVLNHLPLADCLPLKRNNVVADQMKTPPGAVPDSFAIQFVYEKGGRRYAFFQQNLPADLATYKFVERKDKLIRKGNAEPLLKGFTLSGVTDADSTAAVLAQPHAVLFFYQNDAGLPADVKTTLLAVSKAAAQKNIPVYVVTTSLNSLVKNFNATEVPNLQFFKIDFTAFRTAARANPTVYILEEGRIREKRSGYDADDIIKQLDNIR